MDIIVGGIRVKRGLKANLPVLDEGEFGFCTDTNELFIGSPNGNILHPNQNTIDNLKVGDVAELQTQNKNDIVSAINENVLQLAETEANAVVKNKKLDYLNVSLNAHESNISLLNNHIAHLTYQNATVTLIPMVSIDSYSDNIPVKRPGNYDEDNFIIPLIQNGIKIEMLKPHIGINYADVNRATYVPSNYATFFANWKNVLLHFAALCDKYDIPCLSIGCEQQDNSKSDYSSYWQDICQTLKSAYPNLKLVYASNYTEFDNYKLRGVYEHVDYIGVNLYITYANEIYNSNITSKELEKALYLTSNNRINIVKLISTVSEYYGKPIYITETGCTPSDYGLVYSYTPSAIRGALNFNVSALVIETALEGLGKHKDVFGFSWWSTSMPFAYYDENSSVVGSSAGEELMKKYFSERGES